MQGERIKIALTECDICDKLNACLIEEDKRALCLDCIQGAFTVTPITVSLEGM